MSFLVLLSILVIEKLSSLRHRVQDDRFALGELRRLEVRPSLSREPWRVLASWILLPCLALAVLLWILQPVAYGLLALPVHLLALLYSLGRGDLRSTLGPFRDAWRREDPQAALHVAERDLGLGAETPEQLLHKVQGRLLLDGLQGFFAVIFWYCLLGPVAALAYRLLALAAERSQHSGVAGLAGRVQHAFDWLPVRLLAASFALVGNFVALSRVMLHEVFSWELSSAELIARAGRAAADIGPVPLAHETTTLSGTAGLATLDSLWELLLRSAMLWYAAFALWTVLA
jgi:AmpE protein